MEAAWGLRWNGGGGVLLVALIVAEASLGLALEHAASCNATQYRQQGGGRCCNKCPPGQKVKTECGTESPTECEACESGHFQAGWTQEKHCTPHRDCDQNAGFVVHQIGTATENVECRCQNGTHCSSHECQTCRLDTHCGVGEGVQKEASHSTDTVCVECPNGFFSDVESATARCQPWSSCQEQNLVLKENGTSRSDVVCAPRPPPLPDTPRSRLLLLLLLPLAALLLGGAAFCLWCRRRKDLQKPPGKKVQEPAEMAFEDDEELPALPIQETLLGSKPAPQELGKDSHSAEPEQV